LELGKVFGQLLRIKIKLKSGQITIMGKTYSSNFLTYELNKIISCSPDRIYCYLWLSKFFKYQSSNLKVVYEDEFYSYGRVISAAKMNAENTKVVCYGIQHGMFSDNHTVYNISDVELNSTTTTSSNGLPIPDFFITWGNYFSNFLLSNNSLPRSYILELGNPLFIFKPAHKSEIESSSTSNQMKVLYCMTSSKLFYQELPLINKLLVKNEHVCLLIRHHPYFSFDIDRSLFVNCESVNISKTKSILSDLANSHVVLTSAHSTIFIDSLAISKPVVRIKTSIHDSTMDRKYANCITIDKKYKGSLIFSEMFENSLEESKKENFLYLDSDRWLEYLGRINS